MITRWDIHEKLGDARPLNRDATKMSAAVSETNIICTMSIQPPARIAVIDDQLAHVRNVEHADVLSDGLMFFHNAGVLNRHQPSGERHHLRAASYVLVVKRRLFLRGFGHAPN